MKKIYVRGMLLVAAAFLFSKCTDDDATIEHTAGEYYAGEWFVTYSVDGTEVSQGHVPLITSNTAANVATEILISDYIVAADLGGSFWSYKCKAQVDVATKKFSADQSDSHVMIEDEDGNPTPYDININIMNGAIFPKGGLSKTGVVVDSIYFEMQFSDDSPAYGTTYVVSGHRRTGFHDDEY
jgi:hypothetical protein